MRFLILSCGTGGGHNDAGRGAAQALSARGHEVVFLDDYLSMASPKVDAAVCRSYIETVKHVPAAFRGLYAVGRGVSGALHAAGVPSPVYWANAAMAGRVEALLARQPFDAVLMPHLFPAETVTRMRHTGCALPLTVAIATDYTSIPFWEETGCDRYVVPQCPEVAADFARRGLPKEKLLPFGIPAPAAFRPDFDRAAVRAGLGFAPEEKYILIMGGSMGAGGLDTLLHQLLVRIRPGTHIFAMTGTNTALYENLCREYAQIAAVTILPRVACAAFYMQACDLLFTKPGGLSSTESVLCRVPTVLLDPLSQCETANRDTLVRHHCALAPATMTDRAKWGLHLLDSEPAAAAMRRAQAAFLPQNPADTLADWLEAALG